MKTTRLSLLCALLMLASCRSTEPSPTPIAVELVPVSSTELPGPCEIPKGTLAFASYRDGESEIYSMNSGGGDLTRVADVADRVSKPAWSPDGNSMAYIATVRNQYVEIFTMSADGSNQTRLTENWSVDTEPAWAPTGGKIAFSTSRDSYLDIEDGMTYGFIYDFEIYVMNEDGSDQINLTGAPGWDTAPAWSPDGSQIAFQSNRDGHPEIYVMDADGSGQVNLTNHPADDATPAWSPDGSKIAFHSDRAGTFDIYVMEADGTNPVRLTNSTDWDIEAAWSPDGRHIAFYSKREGNFEIYVMDAYGACQVRLTYDHDFDGFPDWRP